LGPKVRERCQVRQSGSAMASSGTDQDGTAPALAGAPTSLLQSLSAREAEILRLIGKGLSRHRIAAELCRSVKTIDGHQDRILRKLGISTRADLMRFAIREGLAQV
ncbi:MAG: response regulator transcription factor, partial [Phycisphaerae bacterium]